MVSVSAGLWLLVAGLWILVACLRFGFRVACYVVRDVGASIADKILFQARPRLRRSIE